MTIYETCKQKRLPYGSRCQVQAEVALENQLALELDDASRRQSGGECTVRTGWRRGGGENLAERSALRGIAVSKVVIRIGEIRMVEDVVEVGSDAERHPLRQLEVLVDGEVGVEEARSAEAVPNLVGEGRSRGGELIERQAIAQTVHAALLRGAEDLGRRIEGSVVGDGDVSVDDGKRQSGAGKEVLRKRPTAEGTVGELVAEVLRCEFGCDSFGRS